MSAPGDQTGKPFQIDPDELFFEYFRSSGPGGQNINKVSTAVRLRFNLQASDALPSGVKERLVRLAGKRLTGDGILIIEARRFRTQERNQQDAVERLTNLVTRAWEPPKPRRPGKPTRSSVERRLKKKKHLSQKKARRGPVRGEE